MEAGDKKKMYFKLVKFQDLFWSAAETQMGRETH